MEIPDLETRVKKVLTDRLGIPLEEIKLDARLVDDLGMDSLDAVELAIATEHEFGVSLSDDQIAKLETTADIMALVRRLVDGQAGSATVREPRPGGTERA